MILLVHGFNVTEKQARKAYAAFSDHLENRNLPSVDHNKIWSFYWPGNVGIRFLSALSYPLQIKKAREAAWLLSAYLSDLAAALGTDLQLTLVAHSLGCRLSLEVLQEVVKSIRPCCSEVNIMLMAAAVPVDMLGTDEPYTNALAQTTFRYCFHSTSDSVLRFGFPPGQTAAGEGFFPQAVGLHGKPRSAS